MMVLFHAGPELAGLLSAARNPYRDLIDASEIEDWLWAIGPVTFVVAASYLVVLGARRTSTVASSVRGSFVELFPFRQCLLATLPLYAAAVAGRGGAATPGRIGTYFESGIIGQFLLVGLVLTTYAAIKEHPGWLLPALGTQSIALLMLGQRTAVIAGLVTVAFLLRRDGKTTTRRQRSLIVVAALMSVVVVSSARVNVGRESFSGESSFQDRAVSLAAGVTGLLDARVRASLANDMVYRVDGNVYGALTLNALDQGVSPIGLVTLRNTAMLAVPSIINPSKIETDVSARSEEAFISAHFGIPLTIDFLPTPLGAGVAYFGRIGLYFLAAMMGATLAIVDRLTRTSSPTAVVTTVGVLSSILYYERGLEGAAITMRGIAALAATLLIVRSIRRVVYRFPPTSGSIQGAASPVTQTHGEQEDVLKGQIAADRQQSGFGSRALNADRT